MMKNAISQVLDEQPKSEPECHFQCQDEIDNDKLLNPNS
jgi:hypothetical protein